MMWTLAVILGVLWALGLVSNYPLGGSIHLLLVMSIVLVAIEYRQKRTVGYGVTD